MEIILLLALPLDSGNGRGLRTDNWAIYRLYTIVGIDFGFCSGLCFKNIFLKRMTDPIVGEAELQHSRPDRRQHYQRVEHRGIAGNLVVLKFLLSHGIVFGQF